MYATTMTARFVDLVRFYAHHEDTMLCDYSPEAVVGCAAAFPGEAPDGPADGLARDFVNAVISDDPSQLPDDLAEHVRRWGDGKA